MFPDNEKRVCGGDFLQVLLVAHRGAVKREFNLSCSHGNPLWPSTQTLLQSGAHSQSGLHHLLLKTIQTIHKYCIIMTLTLFEQIITDDDFN